MNFSNFGIVFAAVSASVGVKAYRQIKLNKGRKLKEFRQLNLNPAISEWCRSLEAKNQSIRLPKASAIKARIPRATGVIVTVNTLPIGDQYRITAAQLQPTMIYFIREQKTFNTGNYPELAMCSLNSHRRLKSIMHQQEDLQGLDIQFWYSEKDNLVSERTALVFKLAPHGYELLDQIPAQPSRTYLIGEEKACSVSD